jgi:hypothetical protein
VSTSSSESTLRSSSLNSAGLLLGFPLLRLVRGDVAEGLFKRGVCGSAELGLVALFDVGDDLVGDAHSAFGQLDAAKQQYDPDEILTPGYEIF